MKKIMLVLFICATNCAMETEKAKEPDSEGEENTKIETVEIENSENFDQRLETGDLWKQDKLSEQALKQEKYKLKFSTMVMWLQVFINGATPEVRTQPELHKFFHALSLRNLKINTLDKYIKEAYNYNLLKIGGRPTELHEKLCAKMKLTRLDLSYNYLEKLSKMFTALQTLTEINLSHNRFTEFPPPVFELGQLKKIDLGNNRISSIDEGGIIKLKNLIKMNLSHNELGKIPNNLSNLPTLKQCWLHNNPFKGSIHIYYTNNPEIFLLKAEKEGGSKKEKKDKERKKINSFFSDDEM